MRVHLSPRCKASKFWLGLPGLELEVVGPEVGVLDQPHRAAEVEPPAVGSGR